MPIEINRFKDENCAKAACKYLCEAFVMGRDYGVTICHAPATSKYDCDWWVLEIPDSCERYRITIEKMQNGATDFEKGWLAAIAYVASKPPEKKTRKKNLPLPGNGL